MHMLGQDPSPEGCPGNRPDHHSADTCEEAEGPGQMATVHLTDDNHGH